MRNKPLMIFDGDCTFCKDRIAWLQQYTQEKVDYRPYQDLTEDFPKELIESCKNAVLLLMPDGSRFFGAAAIYNTLATVGHATWVGWLYKRFKPFQWMSDCVYHWVSGHRPEVSRLFNIFVGRGLGVKSYQVSSWLFIRLLGVIYLIAFFSLGIQMLGLVGSEGILPVSQFLEAVKNYLGDKAYYQLPTLFWFNQSDFFIVLICWSGVALSILLIIGLIPVLLLTLLWSFYLSLSVIGQDFLAFQWDILLLETGFLSIFLAHLQLFSKSPLSNKPSLWMIWLFRLLLFRLMFYSGVVKLLSGDAAWHSLTALKYHYETQPLVNWISWVVHQWPMWFHKLSVFLMFVIELIVPFFILGPRRLRIFAGWVFIFFQILIILTGNYGYFNFLSIVLCILVFDDHVWSKLGFKKWVSRPDPLRPVHTWLRIIIIPLSIGIILLSLIPTLDVLRLSSDRIRPIQKFYQKTAPYRIVNRYGLFAVMTTKRREIIVEGSIDGKDWKVYEFKYKPDRLDERPGFVAPHQPRLDWQMWFAALGNIKQNPWFLNFMVRLLKGSPEVLALLEENPPFKSPPRFVRAKLYQYQFTNQNERHEDGQWWKREYLGLYCPSMSLKEEKT